MYLLTDMHKFSLRYILQEELYVCSQKFKFYNICSKKIKKYVRTKTKTG